MAIRLIDRPPGSAQFREMKSPFSLLSHAVAIGGLLLGIWLWFQPPPTEAMPEMMRIASVVVIAVSLWASGVFPEYFTAIIFFFLAMAFTDAGAPVVFSGFHSAAVWIIFGGLIIGTAVQETGFGKTLARALLRFFPRNYFGILSGITVVGAVLCFIIPSNTGRIVIMMPIFMAMADRVGFEIGSPGRAGLALAVCGGAVYPSLAVLPAAVPNVAWVGSVESIHGIRITFAEYLVANFPVIGLISILGIPVICRVLFPAKVSDAPSDIEASEASVQQTRLIIVLVSALGLWMTAFIHGISPAWVALGAAAVCMLPRVGTVPSSIMVGRVSYAPWFFVAGVLGMGAVVAKAGLGDHISAFLFEAVPLTKGEDFRNFATVSGVSMVISLFTTVPGQPAIMTTLATDISAATGWPLGTVLMMQPLSWAMSMFAYQFPPFILAAHLGGISSSNMAKMILAMWALAWVFMLPLLFLWWQTIGYLS